MSESLALSRLREIVGKLDRQEELQRETPEPGPKGEHRRLCVGLATYDDFDGAWFTLASALMHHREIADQVSFVIVDNHPEGRYAWALKSLEQQVPHLRYVPFSGFRGTSVRDLVFREANADIVCCVDSHVLLRPGALAAVLAYFDDHPDSPDLLQGPMMSADLSVPRATHMDPVWAAGMYGVWGKDARYDGPGARPFEIDLHGLGIFACRRDSWPGFNPRFRGFGGEEGYLHEKIRQRGGRVLCLPALGWVHRFERPAGIAYALSWSDRVRNYSFGWREIGWDEETVVSHFRDYLGAPNVVEPMLAQVHREVSSPFSFFDAVFCLNRDDQPERRIDAQRRFEALDLAWRVEWVAADVTPDNPHRGCAQSWRRMIEMADHRGYETVLIFEDDAVFLDETVNILSTAVEELRGLEWDLCYLGASRHGQQFQPLPQARVLRRCGPVNGTHALAVHRRAFARILADIPTEQSAFDSWLAQTAAIDQYFYRNVRAGAFTAVITEPRVASQPPLLRYPDHDGALADRYTI